MLSTSNKFFFLLVVALVALQSCTVEALPTRRSTTPSPLAKRQQPSLKYRERAVQPTHIAEKREATIADYIAGLTRRAADDAAIAAALSSPAASSSTSIPRARNPKTTVTRATETVKNASKQSSTSIGGQYSNFAAAAGVPSSATATTWVSASNVTLPTHAAKRSVNEKRMVAHPGAPTNAAVKIDVIKLAKLDTDVEFTLLNATSSTSTTSEASSSTAKVASVTAKVNVVRTTTSSKSTAKSTSTSTSSSSPARSTGSAKVATTDAEEDVEECTDSTEKRDSMHYFETPSDLVTREEMMSDDWEDCIVGVDEGCLPIPDF